MQSPTSLTNMPILPEKIEIQGFFAFRKSQVIAFEPLWKSGGLWGILGPNGAGKSSILEAILLALYHDSPRKTSEAEITTRILRRKVYSPLLQVRGAVLCMRFPKKRNTENPKKTPAPLHHTRTGKGQRPPQALLQRLYLDSRTTARAVCKPLRSHFE